MCRRYERPDFSLEGLTAAEELDGVGAGEGRG